MSAACSAEPAQVAVGENYTITASGLPHNNVYRVIELPDGAKMTSWIASPDGTYTIHDTGGFWNGETGVYTYRFVSKVSWPTGTYRETYASCEVEVA